MSWCPGRDLNPHSRCRKKDFKSFASADFATRAGLLSGLTHYTIGVWQQPVRRCLMRVRIPAEQ
jgi:hypothetical protein